MVRKANISASRTDDFICSYPFVMAKFSMSIDELRIVLATVSIIGSAFHGKSLSELIDRQKRAATPDDEEEQLVAFFRESLPAIRIKGVTLELGNGGYLYVKAPYTYFVPDNTKHFDRVKTAFDRLSSTFIYVERDGYWAKSAVVAEPVIRRYTNVEFVIGRTMLCQMLRLAGGFRRLDLGVVMRIRSPYSMRFYTLVAGQKTPTVISLARLRTMFMAEEIYSTDSEFIRCVVEASKRELDMKSPWTFTYEILHGKGRGRGPVEAIRFIPEQNRNTLPVKGRFQEA